jgi:hypothetical protein
VQGDKHISYPCDIVDCEDGTYLGIYTCEESCADAGTCQLHVTLGGESIQGSPFVVHIQPNLNKVLATTSTSGVEIQPLQ